MGSFVFKELGAATFGPPVWNNDVKSRGCLQRWTSFTPVRQDHSFKGVSQVAQVVKKKVLLPMQEWWVRSLGWEDSLE